jgi:hypothetical protein
MTDALGEVTAATATGIAAAALVAGVLALARTRRPALALAVFLDLLLAAGLLRLAGDPGWPAIATAAAVVAVRRLIGVGLRAGGRAWSVPGPRPPAGAGAGMPRSVSVDRLFRPAWRL